MRKPARAIDIPKTSSPFSDHQDEDFVEKCTAILGFDIRRASEVAIEATRPISSKFEICTMIYASMRTTLSSKKYHYLQNWMCCDTKYHFLRKLRKSGVHGTDTRILRRSGCPMVRWKGPDLSLRSVHRVCRGTNKILV